MFSACRSVILSPFPVNELARVMSDPSKVSSTRSGDGTPNHQPHGFVNLTPAISVFEAHISVIKGHERSTTPRLELSLSYRPSMCTKSWEWQSALAVQPALSVYHTVQLCEVLSPKSVFPVYTGLPGHVTLFNCKSFCYLAPYLLMSHVLLTCRGRDHIEASHERISFNAISNTIPSGRYTKES